MRWRREFGDFVGLECDTLMEKKGMNALSFKKVVMKKEGWVVVRAEGRQANARKLTGRQSRREAGEVKE